MISIEIESTSCFASSTTMMPCMPDGGRRDPHRTGICNKLGSCEGALSVVDHPRSDA